MSAVAKVKVPFAVIGEVVSAVVAEDEPGAGEAAHRPSDGVSRGFVTQATETLVTLAPATVPEPFETVQVCPEGWRRRR